MAWHYNVGDMLIAEKLTIQARNISKPTQIVNREEITQIEGQIYAIERRPRYQWYQCIAEENVFVVIERRIRLA